MDRNGGDATLRWEIDGIAPETRRAAEAAAAAEGLSVGAWLSRLLTQAAATSGDGPGASGNPAAASGPSDQALDELHRLVADHLQRSDARILAIVEPLMALVDQMAGQIESISAGRNPPPATDKPSDDVPA